MTERSLTVTWQDPFAAFADGRKFPRAIDYLRAIRDGRIPEPPIARLQSMLPPGKTYTTLELKVNLVRAVTIKTGRLRATGKIVHLGRQTATAEGRLEDVAGKLYAHGTSTCIVLDAGA